jgi:competence protein ComEC
MSSINSFHFTPVLCAALGAAGGFYVLFNTSFSVIIISVSVFVVLLCLFRVLASVNRQSRTLQLTSFCSTALAVGLFLGLCAAFAGRNEVVFGIPENNIKAIEGILQEDPRIISGGRAMANISLQKCAGADGLRVTSKGEITVFFTEANAQRLKEFGRGAQVFAEGNLRSADRGWIFSANSLHVVSPANSIERMRTNIRLHLINRFDKENWGGLALALLLGIRDNLDSSLTIMYRNAGLSYILALSGMHLAILTALISFLLKKPLGLKASAITGAVIIILYCFFTGPMPSLNRAALMYVLGVLAILGSLPKNTLSVLSLSFLIQIIITPAAGNTLSFILSYSAMIGILVISKALVSLFSGKIPDFLLQPLSVSAGAFLATAGICSFSFGIIAPAGIIAGLAIIPLTTVFMIGSIIWLFLDMISLSILFGFPLSVLYNFMQVIISLAGNAPGISANPFLILVFSFILSLLVVFLDYRRRAGLLKLRSLEF